MINKCPCHSTPCRISAPPGPTAMETVVRRCPFLSRVPQAFLQKAGKSLLFYAQNCPKMMEVGATMAPRALSGSAVHCQQVKETPPASESECQPPSGVQATGVTGCRAQFFGGIISRQRRPNLPGGRWGFPSPKGERPLGRFLGAGLGHFRGEWACSDPAVPS